MTEESSPESVQERVSALRQGAGNYVNLCGVLAGFVAVIMVLVLTPGFFPRTDTNLHALELVIFLLSVASFGYIFTALSFVNISFLRYKSLKNMRKEFAFSQALFVLFTILFLGGVAALNFYAGTYYVGFFAVGGLLLTLYYLIKDWWALARRPPPKK